jgi:HK97 family phage portal protein
VSRLRRALQVEERSVTDAVDTSYGQAGQGWWGSGMVWNSGGSSDVSVDSAMRLSAVWGCLRVLSEAIATLPMDTYRRSDGARLAYRPRPEYLSFNPPQGSRIDYLSMVELSLLTNGNAFVATPRDAMGVPVDLVPLDPTLVEVHRQTADPTPERPFRRGEVYFQVGGEFYSVADILHVKGMTLPGQLRGLNPIAAAREVIDGARKAQEFGGSFFGNAAVPPAVIEMPTMTQPIPGMKGPEGNADMERAKRIAQVWNETHGGTSNAGKVGVLVGGATLKTVAVTPEDAQWLDTRRFGVQEIARIFGVPPHLIADSSNSTSWGSGLAEQNLAFGQLSLRPWIERIEDAHTRLLTSHGLGDVFVKLNLDALLRASLKDRYASYAQAIQAGFMTANEARALEDMPPVPGGDVMLTVPVGAGATNVGGGGE